MTAKDSPSGAWKSEYISYFLSMWILDVGQTEDYLSAKTTNLDATIPAMETMVGEACVYRVRPIWHSLHFTEKMLWAGHRIYPRKPSIPKTLKKSLIACLVFHCHCFPLTQTTWNLVTHHQHCCFLVWSILKKKKKIIEERITFQQQHILGRPSPAATTTETSDLVSAL